MDNSRKLMGQKYVDCLLFINKEPQWIMYIRHIDGEYHQMFIFDNLNII